jgi:hypothetical protein
MPDRDTSGAWFVFHNFPVIKISSLLTPLLRIPSPTSFSLPYIAAQSICRYPERRAISTARSTSCGFACQVPKPTAGIRTPLFNWKERLRAMLQGGERAMKRESRIECASYLSQLGLLPDGRFYLCSNSYWDRNS